MPLFGKERTTETIDGQVDPKIEKLLRQRDGNLHPDAVIFVSNVAKIRYMKEHPGQYKEDWNSFTWLGNTRYYIAEPATQQNK